MGKVGIVTLVGHTNFGNRLQNYALQELIRSLGHDAVTIRNSPRMGDGAGPIKRKIEHLKRSGLRAFVLKAQSMKKPPAASPRELARIEGNREFTRAFVEESEVAFEDLSDPLAFARDFQYFVVGSDQVWNPSLRHLNQIDFLTFAEEGQRVAYAASIGVPELSRYEQRLYSTYLRGIPNVSVREFEAAKIVQDLTGRRVPVVLDPTMLLDSGHWSDLATVPDGLDLPDYVAKFYLGDEDALRKSTTLEFARKRGLRVVDLNDPASNSYITSPFDFLGAIHNAAFLLTDSFHGAVFATLFETPYAIKGRGQMNSRFTTLEMKTGISAREWQTVGDLEASSDIDWVSVNSRITRERTDSFGFLSNALGGHELRG